MSRLSEREISMALDDAVARNGGPFRAYSGEPGQMRDEQWRSERARENARARKARRRQYKHKSARDTLIENLLALPDVERAEAIKLLNARKQ